MRGLTQRFQLSPAALWLLAATFVTTIGNSMHTFTVGKLLYDRTGSVAAFGWVIILEQVAAFVMQFVAGPWVDRGDPRRTCIQVELIRGGFVCLASLMVGSQQLLIWIMLMSLVIRAAHPFYRAAMFTLGPAAVEPDSLGRFNGYSNFCLQAGHLLGLVLVAPIFDYGGASISFMVNGLTFMFSALAVSRVALLVQNAAPAKTESMSPWAYILKSWHEILLLLRSEAGLVWHLTLSTIAAVVVQLYNLVEVAIVAERYGGSAYWLSMASGFFTVGAMLSATLVASLMSRWGTRAAIIFSVGGQSLCFLLLGAIPNPWLTLALIFAIGTMNTISLTVLTTSLQLRVRGPVKGRIGTTRNLLAALFAGLLVPLITQITNASLAWALAVIGVVCLVFTTIALVLGSPRVLGSKLFQGVMESNAAMPATSEGLRTKPEGTP